MTSPITVYKLITLYMLDRTGDALARTTITDFLLDRGLTNNYLSSQQAISELLESGLITSETMGNRTMLRITGEGQETLRFFEHDLNADIRKECTDFLRKNGMTIRDEADVGARYYRMAAGDVEVDLSARERGRQLVNIRLSVPDEQIAKTVVQHWLEKNQEVYQQLVGQLL